MPLLFSYGTLQQSNVQLATFGRELPGTPDSLVGYEQSMVPINDPEVVRTSGKTHHPIVRYTGDATAKVPGTVFEITAQELECADRYEVSHISGSPLLCHPGAPHGCTLTQNTHHRRELFMSRDLSNGLGRVTPPNSRRSGPMRGRWRAASALCDFALATRRPPRRAAHLHR